MGGCCSIRNDDAIDWLRNPVVPWRVCDLPFLPFFICKMRQKPEVRADPQAVHGKTSIEQLTQVSVVIRE